MFEQPKQFLDAWLRATNAGEVETVTALYAVDAVLLPTFSNRTLHTPEGIRDYFEKLGTQTELAVSLHDKTVVIHPLAEGHWCLSGIYRWTFKVDSEPLDFEARFSFVVDLTSAAPILHHHSSQIPRML